MEKTKITNALQDLIIRLQDAEKGYQEVGKATTNVELKTWTKKYANERHEMHRDLEKLAKLLGSDTEVKTSYLGDLHRMFIDIRLNAIDDDVNAAIEEIERGSHKLIEDYDNVLDNLTLPNDIEAMLREQKAKIVKEVATIKSLQPVF